MDGERPCAITPEVWHRLLTALDAGAPMTLACQYAGIGYETWLAECRRIPEFAVEVEKVGASHRERRRLRKRTSSLSSSTGARQQPKVSARAALPEPARFWSGATIGVNTVGIVGHPWLEPRHRSLR